MNNNLILIIPARLKSTRLPNKPLRLINNKPLIYWTWLNCTKAINKKLIFIATDNIIIKKKCEEYGINVIMTSEKLVTGTDRISEASKFFKTNLIINLQGDEPFINPKDIKKFCEFALKNKSFVTNAYAKLKSTELAKNKNIPKLVLKNDNSLLYISRSVIPGSKNNQHDKIYKQICMYGFPKKILNSFYGLEMKKTQIENIEDIEIIRLLENDIKVKMMKVSDNKLAIDTPSDLKKAKLILI